jgi:hypothetical protein
MPQGSSVLTSEPFAWIALAAWWWELFAQLTFSQALLGSSQGLLTLVEGMASVRQTTFLTGMLVSMQAATDASAVVLLLGSTGRFLTAARCYLQPSPSS